MAQNDQTAKDDKVEKERPASVRDVINAAIEEHAESKIDAPGKNDERRDRKDEFDGDEKSEKDERRNERRESKTVTDKSEIKEIKEIKEKEIEKTEKVAKEPKEKKEVDSTENLKVKEEKAPSILPKEMQDAWKDISSDVRNFVTKTQKDLADTKAELGRTKQSYREIDAVIDPYRGAIQQWGVTPAQTVERLFNWMGELSGPNRYNAIHELARGFNIDLPALYAQQDSNQPQTQQQIQQQTHQQDQNTQPTQDNQQQQPVHPYVAQAIEAMYEEVNNLKGAQQQQKQNAAAQYVESWAGKKPDGSFEKKPHFPQVRQHMFSLLQGGTIPLVNGQLDLDTAYESACYSHPEIRALMLEQQAESKQVQIKEARDKKAAEDRAKVAKAKSLNIGIKPSSPTGDFSSDSKKLNSKNTSVRDFIMSAIRESSS